MLRALVFVFECFVFVTINEKFYKISFLSQILAMVLFCFPPISMKGTASNIYNNVYRAI